MLLDLDGRVTASQLVTQTSSASTAARRRAAMLLQPIRATQLIPASDGELVEGWLTFSLAQWLSFTANDWNAFELSERIGQRSGSVTASQLLAQNVVELHARSRSGRRQLLAPAAGKIRRPHVTATQLVNQTPEPELVGSVSASQLI